MVQPKVPIWSYLQGQLLGQMIRQLIGGLFYADKYCKTYVKFPDHLWIGVSVMADPSATVHVRMQNDATACISQYVAQMCTTTYVTCNKQTVRRILIPAQPYVYNMVKSLE